MDSKFVKLIDYSLLPFSLTILGKTLGLYGIISLLHIEWGIASFSESIISVTPVVYGRDLVTVSTYSNLIMYVALFLGFCFYLLSSNLRHQRKFNVRLFRRLMQLRFMNLFQKGIFLYTRMFVWLAYLWLVTCYILLDSALGRTEAWLALFAFVLTAIVSASLYSDLLKEYRMLITTSQNRDYI